MEISDEGRENGGFELYYGSTAIQDSFQNSGVDMKQCNAA